MDLAATTSLTIRTRLGEADSSSSVVSLDRERDARWIQRIIAGDPDAFRPLVEHYQDRVFRIALGVIGNREEAWDVSQEAFLRVHRSLHRFQLGQSFYTWLYRIVVNLSIDALRKRSQDRTVALEESGECVGVDCPPETDLHQQELREKVQTVLALLPPRYRAVLVLKDIEELGCWEIARVVGCTHATARWRLHKARKLFKETWERYLRRSSIPEADGGLPPDGVESSGFPKGPAFES